MSFYLLDKNSGITSNKALSLLKKEINVKKAGFSGVLDPFATGLLIVATNGDTKFLDLFLHSPKTYSGKILFGKTTDTLDIDGEVVEEKDVIELTLDKIKSVIENKFIGKINQVPPKYSNIKVNGKRAHELSRNEVEFELKEVEREIYKMEVSNFKDNEVEFNVTVSSGTYIRSLANDIGKELDLPAMLTVLRRESVGTINVPNSTLEIGRDYIVPFNRLDVDESTYNNFLNGKDVDMESIEDDLLLYNVDRCMWIKRKNDNTFKIHKNIE